MSLITRASNILKSPKTEWDVIATESANSVGLVSGYAVPLLLLSHIAKFIGMAFFAAAVTTVMGITFGMPFWIGSTVIAFFLSLIGLFIAAFVVNALAPKFLSTQNPVSAMKLVVYSNTGLWVGGLLSFLPGIGGIATAVGACYSVYLFYLGVPKLMLTPKEKVVSYMIWSAIVIIVIHVIMSSLTAAIGVALFATTAATMIHMN